MATPEEILPDDKLAQQLGISVDTFPSMAYKIQRCRDSAIAETEREGGIWLRDRQFVHRSAFAELAYGGRLENEIFDYIKSVGDAVITATDGTQSTVDSSKVKRTTIFCSGYFRQFLFIDPSDLHSLTEAGFHPYPYADVQISVGGTMDQVDQFFSQGWESYALLRFSGHFDAGFGGPSGGSLNAKPADHSTADGIVGNLRPHNYVGIN